MAEWFVIAAYSLLLVPLCAPILNFFTPRSLAQRLSLGTLDKLLLQAQQQRMPIQVTLNTGKVYVGLVTAITDPNREVDMLKLIPMFSGYRDAENRMVLTTDYEQVYKALRGGRAEALKLPTNWLSQFELAIRADTILTATLFSPAVYAEFRPDRRASITPERPKPAPQELSGT